MGEGRILYDSETDSKYIHEENKNMNVFIGKVSQSTVTFSDWVFLPDVT